MFPIRDHNPSQRVPVVTYALILANVVIFLMTLGMSSDTALDRLYWDYALLPAKLTAEHDYTTLITSAFLHGGFWHLAGNMLFLWIFADNLEDQFGHVLFLLFYLACACAAGLVHVAADPSSMVPTIGASGAIGGVMGGYLLLFPRARVDILVFIVIFIRVFTLPAWVLLLIWFGLQLFSGANDPGQAGGVAYWAHAGGFIGGFLLCLPLWLRRGAQRFWQKTDGHPPHPEQPFALQRTLVPRAGQSRRGR